MIQDGYGNELTPEELVSNYRGWVHRVAGSMVHSSDWAYDDIVQEAFIMLWRTAERVDSPSAVYLTKAMRSRMLGVVSGKPMTGGDSKPGPKSRPDLVRVDWQDQDLPVTLEGLLEAPDVLSAVELAYHEGEILKCLSELPIQDRRYVYQRFWEGKTDTEIAAEMGVSNKMLGGRWKKTIKPKIEKALSHLSTA